MYNLIFGDTEVNIAQIYFFKTKGEEGSAKDKKAKTEKKSTIN